MNNYFVKNNEYKIDFNIVDFDDSIYFVPKYAEHRPACKSILNKTYYEKQTHDLIESITSAFSGSVVHAGSFFGDMIPSFSKKVKGKLFTFEPVLENYILSKICIEKNNLENVVIFNNALSDKIKNVKIKTINNGIHLGGASTIKESGFLSSTLTLDSLDFDELLLIHLDIEGHELNALKGSEKTIISHKPILAIEDNSNNCSDYLNGIGYNKIKNIPGLSIWAHDNDYKKSVIK